MAATLSVARGRQHSDPALGRDEFPSPWPADPRIPTYEHRLWSPTVLDLDLREGILPRLGAHTHTKETSANARPITGTGFTETAGTC